MKLKTNWQKEMKQKYKMGVVSTFTITGNIQDYGYIEDGVGYSINSSLIEVAREVGIDEIYSFDISKKGRLIESKRFKKEKEEINNNPELNKSQKKEALKALQEEYIKEMNKKQDISWDKMCEELRTPRKTNVCYILDYPEFLIPHSNQYLNPEDKARMVELHKTISDPKFFQSKNMLILVTDNINNVNDIFLNSRNKEVKIPLPNDTLRKEAIDSLIKPLNENSRSRLEEMILTMPDNNPQKEKLINLQKHDEKLKNLKLEIDKNSIVKLTAGMQLINIENVLLEAQENGILTYERLYNAKKEILLEEHGEIIELMDTRNYALNQFAGQSHIKEFLNESVIQPMREGRHEIVPKGVLFMGPPGTGKTYLTKCLAGDAGISFVNFNIGKILDKYVGESEKKLEKVLSVFKAIAPVGIFIDEIDQVFQRGGSGDDGGSSVNRNFFQRILTELSKNENRGKLIWFAATNYPNKIDGALKRTGRFDKKIPFLPPTEEERVKVFKLHINNMNYKIGDINYKELASQTEGYTQSEIETITVKALELAQRKQLEKIDQELLNKALDYIIRADNEQIDEMIDLALLEVNDKEFLPKQDIYIQRYKELTSTKK